MSENILEILKLVGPILLGISALIAYFKRKPPTKIDQVVVEKLKNEVKLLELSVREESVNLLRGLVTTQTEVIENLRINVQSLRDDVHGLRDRYNNIKIENRELKEKLIDALKEDD